ncbi:MAG: hypothetical protein ACI8W9_001779, partial [Psychromonas sp.]
TNSKKMRAINLVKSHCLSFDTIPWSFFGIMVRENKDDLLFIGI